MWSLRYQILYGTGTAAMLVCLIMAFAARVT